MRQQGPHFSPHSQAKTKDKSKNLRTTVPSGTSDVVTASLYTEKTRPKKCWIMIIIIMNKWQESTVFHRLLKFTSAIKQKPEK